MRDLFDTLTRDTPGGEPLGPGTRLLRGLASEQAPAVLDALGPVLRQAPLRHLSTPGGRRMSVAMSNCGAVGWISDRQGYRYQATDPISAAPWPKMPTLLRTLAREAAAKAGWPAFMPDVCLINRYRPGNKLSLHQDRDEADTRHPIVSFSLGVPATFLLGGTQRSDRTLRLLLLHGDVMVWGGPDRLRFHGVQPLAPDWHPLTGSDRINLTFRRARA